MARSEDVDYYAFEVKKGERITAEVEGARLGIALFDPYVAIMDAKRFELASSDDAALIWQDAFALVVAPEDGTYLVQVRERPTPGPTTASTGSTSATSPGPRRPSPPAASSARRSTSS